MEGNYNKKNLFITPVPNLVAGRYAVGRKIGKGSFGEVYIATDLNSGKDVAIKFEHVYSSHPQLFIENRVYKALQGQDGFSNVHFYGIQGEYLALVMDLLGANLEELFRFCKCQFSLKTIVMLAEQLITRVEILHKFRFLHRDLKPENLMMGMGETGNMVYLTDFGLAKPFSETSIANNLKPRITSRMSGTAKFASLNTQIGLEQSPRDDLEAVGYVLCYFWKGSLPWDNFRGSTRKQTMDKIMEEKMKTSVKELCTGLPEEFAIYFTYCRSLGFNDTPDYAYIKSLFQGVSIKRAYPMDHLFDWITIHRDLTASQSRILEHLYKKKSNNRKRKHRENYLARLVMDRIFASWRHSEPLYESYLKICAQCSSMAGEFKRHSKPDKRRKLTFCTKPEMLPVLA